MRCSRQVCPSSAECARTAAPVTTTPSSTHFLPYKRNPFVGSLRHWPVQRSGECRGLLDLIAPVPDASPSPTKPVRVLTRCQFISKDAPVKLREQLPPLKCDSADVKAGLEAWAVQMGQFLTQSA